MKNLNSAAARAGTESVSKADPVVGITAGPPASFHDVDQFPSSARFPVSMTASPDASPGMSVTAKLTGISLPELTKKGAAFELVPPCEIVTFAEPAETAGTTAVICSSDQCVILAGFPDVPCENFTRPGVCPKPAPLIVTAT